MKSLSESEAPSQGSQLLGHLLDLTLKVRHVVCVLGNLISVLFVVRLAPLEFFFGVFSGALVELLTGGVVSRNATLIKLRPFIALPPENLSRRGGAGQCLIEIRLRLRELILHFFPLRLARGFCLLLPLPPQHFGVVELPNEPLSLVLESHPELRQYRVSHLVAKLKVCLAGVPPSCGFCDACRPLIKGVQDLVHCDLLLTLGLAAKASKSLAACLVRHRSDIVRRHLASAACPHLLAERAERVERRGEVLGVAASPCSEGVAPIRVVNAEEPEDAGNVHSCFVHQQKLLVGEGGVVHIDVASRHKLPQLG
mmetsp:Transcript_17595/g.40631  ORF Transcript_17595/g.40631 Transcript_17595/m.40631 type:complete len:311 (-) Transcript_17595:1548-2480(-)